jgi:hypothetical protein
VSAQEIIEQIKALSPKEQVKVLEFARSLPLPQKSIRYATSEQARTAGDKVLAEHDAVFRMLAQ